MIPPYRRFCFFWIWRKAWRTNIVCSPTTSPSTDLPKYFAATSGVCA